MTTSPLAPYISSLEGEEAEPAAWPSPQTVAR